MPANTPYHTVVIQALSADGWRITHEPLRLTIGGIDYSVDLGAENGERRIAVLIESFSGDSPLQALKEVVGRYLVSQAVLKNLEPDRMLYLAVPTDVAEGALVDSLAQLMIKELHLPVLVFDEHQRRVVRRMC